MIVLKYCCCIFSLERILEKGLLNLGSRWAVHDDNSPVPSAYVSPVFKVKKLRQASNNLTEGGTFSNNRAFVLGEKSALYHIVPNLPPPQEPVSFVEPSGFTFPQWRDLNRVTLCLSCHCFLPRLSKSKLVAVRIGCSREYYSAQVRQYFPFGASPEWLVPASLFPMALWHFSLKLTWSSFACR